MDDDGVCSKRIERGIEKSPLVWWEIVEPAVLSLTLCILRIIFFSLIKPMF